MGEGPRFAVRCTLDTLDGGAVTTSSRPPALLPQTAPPAKEAPKPKAHKQGAAGAHAGKKRGASTLEDGDEEGGFVPLQRSREGARPLKPSTKARGG